MCYKTFQQKSNQPCLLPQAPTLSHQVPPPNPDPLQRQGWILRNHQRCDEERRPINSRQSHHRHRLQWKKFKIDDDDDDDDDVDADGGAAAAAAAAAGGGGGGGGGNTVVVVTPWWW